MLKKILLGGGMLAVVALLAVVAVGANATDEYAFLVRGIVTENNTTTKTVRVYVTHTSPAAQNDLAGNVQDFSVSTATFYKWVSGVKKTVNQSAATVGSEVVLKGVKKTSGQFNVTALTVNDRSFEIVGKIREHDTALRRVKILVGTSTYKQAFYVNKEVAMQYDDNTVFMSLGKVINSDEVTADNQTVKVRGVVSNGAWELSRFWDDYK